MKPIDRIHKGMRDLRKAQDAGKRKQADNRLQQTDEPPDAEQLRKDEMTRKSFAFLHRAGSGQ